MPLKFVASHLEVNKCKNSTGDEKFTDILLVELVILKFLFVFTEDNDNI
jgi:hypothetical protein